MLIRIILLLAGLYYAGYINESIKGNLSEIDRLIVGVIFIWGIYSGIIYLERFALNYFSKKPSS